MSNRRCNCQSVLSKAEQDAALALDRCELCSRTTSDLARLDRTMEVCGVEHGFDMERGERILHAIPICSECHRKHHLNAEMKSDPCPFSARDSWELFALNP